MSFISNLFNTSTMHLAINLTSEGSCLSHQVYSTGDEIAGEVVVTPNDDVHVDDLDISLIGYTQTRLDSFGPSPTMSLPSITEKRFLHLEQPTEKSLGGMILKANRPYFFPFNFTVPEQLLPSSCPSCNSDDHLLLPPTMGGGQHWEHNGEVLDDPTPSMVKVSYKITAKLVYSKQYALSDLSSSSHKVCIVPEFPEAPPLFLRDASEYRLRQEKAFSRGFLKGRSGSLVMEAQQPSALKGGLRMEWSPASTSLVLRFDPAAEDCLPPPLEDVKRKIQAATVFRGGQMEDPIFGQLARATQRSYSEAIHLPSLHVSGARWQKHGPSWAHEQLHGGGRPDVVAPSSSYSGEAYYLLKLSIPIEYPAGKALVPTFNSCLVSRTYRLDLTLTFSSLSSLTVRVPLQLCT
ncbi:Arrestin (or s-antigen) n-terminal domain containing protein [Neofusicoccum parvum]|nr:Arrestin (or s-antigen) n-terminal domain containing protein [Neofusicoccum parvum]